MMSLQNLFEFNYIMNLIKQFIERTSKFGNCSVIMVGDGHQLPPVLEKCLWSTNTNKMTPSEKQGFILFTSIQDVIILSSNYRQRNDMDFQTLLLHTREGQITDDDYRAYSQRVVGSDEVPDLRNLVNPLCLFGQNSHVNAFNGLLQKKTIALNNQYCKTKCPIYDIQAKDIKCEKGCEDLSANERKDLFKKHPNDTAGLSGLLTVTVGDIIALRKNIDHRCGLVTNARGKIVGFGLKSGEIFVIFVQMFKLVSRQGLQFENLKSNIIPVMRYKAQFTYRDKQIIRSQFPIALNYANTVHSVQSLTHYDALILDPKSCKFNGRLFYTGASRCEKLSNLILLRKFQISEIAKKPSEDIKLFDKSMQERYINTIIKYRKYLPIGFDLNTLQNWQHINMYLSYTYEVAKLHCNIMYDIQSLEIYQATSSYKQSCMKWLDVLYNIDKPIQNSNAPESSIEQTVKIFDDIDDYRLGTNISDTTAIEFIPYKSYELCDRALESIRKETNEVYTISTDRYCTIDNIPISPNMITTVAQQDSWLTDETINAFYKLLGAAYQQTIFLSTFFLAKSSK